MATAKKEVRKGEMGYKSNDKEFEAAMQKEWESRPQGAVGKNYKEEKESADEDLNLNKNKNKGRLANAIKTVQSIKK